ncbi:MAG TPA: DUF1844 domain-containing protein [Myxococcota bacterium]|nr:DUF1844 domain-containing protein [Myxococcota bacterium]
MNDERAVPPVTFSSFVITLAHTALVHLGEVSDPTGGGRHVDLQLARHSIDAIAMLEDKTKGNLDDEERRLMEGVLHELRGKFVDVAKRAP